MIIFILNILNIVNKVNIPYSMKLLIQELESMSIAARLITEENVNTDIFNNMIKNISKYSIENDFLDDIDDIDDIDGGVE